MSTNEYQWCPRCPTGVRSEFVVKTANAGAGALSVTIDGPSKVTLDCVECAEGHRVTYTPMAPGNYLISIKYGGPHHIVGSPFKAKVTGKGGTVVSPWVSQWVSLWVSPWCPYGCPYECPHGVAMSVPMVSLWVSQWVSISVSL